MKLRKKVWLCVCMVCIMTIAAFCFAACGHAAAHTHHYTLKHDGDYHWQECDAAGCDEKTKDKAAHDTAGVGGVCSVCGYTEALLTYKTLKATDDTVYGKVSNSTQVFSFANEVTAHGGATYTVSIDMDGAQGVSAQAVPLEIGDNTFYIRAIRGDEATRYTVTIRRRPIWLVTYKTEDGAIFGSRQIEEDGLITESHVRKPGYTLVRCDYDFTAPIVQNTEITAHMVADTYTVKLDPNGGTVSDDTQSVTYDSAYTLPVPTRQNHTFIGWYSGEEKVADSAVWRYTDIKSLSAHWRIHTYRVKITQNTDGGSVFGAGAYEHGTRVSVTATRYPGYTFVGWFDGETKLSEEDSYTVAFLDKDMHLTAMWEANAEMRNFAFTSTADTCTITGVKDKTATQIQIPDYVTGIGAYAFSGCTGMTSIEIPRGVTRIGDGAFCGCRGLTSITIPRGVTSIGIYVFKDCIGLMRIVIPAGVTSIGGYAFYGCLGLESIAIPNTVTDIGYRAFEGCDGMTSIDIPDSVTHIGWYAFSACGNLKRVTIGAGVTSIGEYAFFGCRSLESVEIPVGAESIESYAFRGCDGLTSITIPRGVRNIGYGAFYDCDNLTIFCEAERVSGDWHTDWNADDRPVVLRCTQVSVTESGLQWVWDNRGDAYIVKYAGHDVEVAIPSEVDGHTVTSIAEYAFRGCRGLTNITVPVGVTRIGHEAFLDCDRLASITIPRGVTHIGYGAFAGCSALTRITVASGNVRYFVAGNCLIDSETKTLVAGCQNGSIPSDGSVMRIGWYAFSDRIGLTDITIPVGVTHIGRYAFSGCTGLADMTVPSGVRCVESGAFAGCGKLASITIPVGVTNIGAYAFDGCGSLTIYGEAESKPSGWDTNWNGGKCPVVWRCTQTGVTESGLRWALKTDGTMHIVKYVGDAAESAIPAEIDGHTVTSIVEWAFRGCTKLTRIVIPDSVTRIEANVFYGCGNLTIYCEAESKPVGWAENWNNGNRPVVWGYKGEGRIKNEGMKE